MKKANVFCRLVCLALVLIMTFGLCACPAGEPATGTTGTTASTSGTTNPGTTPGTNPGDVTDAVYENGAAVNGAGAEIAEGSFALTTHTPDEANAIQENNLSTVVRKGIQEGKTYLLTSAEASKLNTSGRTTDGKGAIIIAPAGIVIDSVTDFELTNVTIIGQVKIQNSRDVTFANVDIQNPNGAALVTDAASTVIRVNDSRLEGKVALENAATYFILTNSYSALPRQACAIPQPSVPTSSTASLRVRELPYLPPPPSRLSVRTPSTWAQRIPVLS